MRQFLEGAVLLAQQGRYERGLAFFRWGVTGVGVAILIAALGVFFSKGKDPEKEMAPAMKLVATIVLGAVGLGVIGYAWFGI